MISKEPSLRILNPSWHPPPPPPPPDLGNYVLFVAAGSHALFKSMKKPTATQQTPPGSTHLPPPPPPNGGNHVVGCCNRFPHLGQSGLMKLPTTRTMTPNPLPLSNHVLFIAVRTDKKQKHPPWEQCHSPPFLLHLGSVCCYWFSHLSQSGSVKKLTLKPMPPPPPPPAR